MSMSESISLAHTVHELRQAQCLLAPMRPPDDSRTPLLTRSAGLILLQRTVTEDADVDPLVLLILVAALYTAAAFIIYPRAFDIRIP